MDKQKEQKKVMRWTKTSFKWLTPIGMLKAVYDKESSENAAIISTTDENYIKSRAIIGIGTSIFGLCLSLYGIYQSIPDTPTANTSSFTLMLLVVALFCLLRTISKYKLLKSIKPTKTQSMNPDSKSKLEMDDIAASILLFRITVFKYTYMVAAAFSVALLLTPRNVYGIKQYISQGTLNLLDANVTVITSLLLSCIFIIKFITAKRDINFVKTYDAAPQLHGYVTINNAAYELIKAIVILLAVAYIGDKLIVLTATRIPTVFAGVFPIVLMGYMIALSYRAFRSAVCLSGLQTENSQQQLNPIKILLLRIFKLPKPNPNEAVLVVPNVNLIVAISFGLTLFVANSTGVTSIIVLIPVVIFQGILMAIDEFHVELSGTYND